jgi:hypothetical protein
MPYPRIVGGQACGLGLSASEHEFVADFIDLLAREVEEAAADAGVNFFAQNLVAFDGIQLCDDKKGANHLKLEPTDGHRAIADLLAPYVEELLAKPAAERNPQPGDGNVPVLTPEQQRLADRAEQLLADRQWIVDEGYETVWRLIAPLILLLFSGIVLAAGVLRFDFFLANALRSGDAPDPDDGDHDDGGDGDHGGGGDG